ncbi:MAG: lipopolysaccharide biosynthesis protein [Pseudomonadota bacterium]
MTQAASHEGLLGRVMANAGLLLGGRAVNAALSLAYMALAARTLGLSEFGVLVLINTFAQFVADIARFQTWQTVLQFGAAPLAEDRRADFQRVVRFGLLLDLIGAAAGAILGVVGAFLLGPHVGLPREAAGPAALYALTIVFMVPTSQIGLLRLFDRFGLLSAQAAIGSAVRLAGGLVGIVIGAPVAFFLIVWAAGTLAGFLYVTFAALAEMRRRGLLADLLRSEFPSAPIPGGWRFAWAANASGSLEVAFTHVATLVVGALLGAADAGLWRIARQIADALAKPARLLIPALYPELAKLRASGSHAGMRALALRVGLVGGGGATLLLLVAVLAGEALLTLVMGPDFGTAAPTMIWQVAAAVIGVWALPLEPMLVSMGKPGAVLRVRLVVAAAFLVALPPIVAAHGLPGAGAALVGATLALALGMLWSLQKLVRKERLAH